MINTFLFVIFPYLAVILAVLFSVYRYYTDAYSFSTVSTQFLEDKKLFWASLPWHYGILSLLLAHLLAVLFPAFWGHLLGSPIRLYVLEATGLALGLLTVLGVAGLLARRMTSLKVAVITNTMDLVLLVALLFQAASGVYIAAFLRWGSAWYLDLAVPWLWSLVRLSPQPNALVALPWIIKLHIIGAFVLVLLFPFSKLVHTLFNPFKYLRRSPQLVIWQRNSPWE